MKLRQLKYCTLIYLNNKEHEQYKIRFTSITIKVISFPSVHHSAEYIHLEQRVTFIEVDSCG